MTNLVASGLEQMGNLGKLLKASELGLTWGETLFPKTQEWRDLIQTVRGYSEPFIMGSCARSVYKWMQGVGRGSFCSSCASMKTSVARYISHSANVTEKLFKLGSWLNRIKAISICDHVLPEVSCGAIVAEAISSGLDMGLELEKKDKSWKEASKKAMDLAAAVLILAVMAETGLPVQEVILVLKTCSLGISTADLFKSAHRYVSQYLSKAEDDPGLEKSMV